MNRKIELAFENIGVDQYANLPSTSGRVDLVTPEDDIFTGLENLPGAESESESEVKEMSSESLAQFARRQNAKKMAARRQAGGSGGSQIMPTREVRQEEMARKTTLAELILEQNQVEVLEANLTGQKRPAETVIDLQEASIEKRPRVDTPPLEDDSTEAFVIQPRTKNVPVARRSKIPPWP